MNKINNTLLLFNKIPKHNNNNKINNQLYLLYLLNKTIKHNKNTNIQKKINRLNSIIYKTSTSTNEQITNEQITNEQITNEQITNEQNTNEQIIVNDNYYNTQTIILNNICVNELYNNVSELINNINEKQIDIDFENINSSINNITHKNKKKLAEQLFKYLTI